MNTPLTGIGQALAVLRKRRRLTQSEAAKKASMAVSSLSRYELEKVEIGSSVLGRYLAVLGADLQELDQVLRLVRKESPPLPPPPPDILAGLDELAAIPPEQQAVLADLAKYLHDLRQSEE